MLRGKPYNIKTQVKYVISINEYVINRPTLITVSSNLLNEQQTRGLPHVRQLHC